MRRSDGGRREGEMKFVVDTRYFAEHSLGEPDRD